MSGTVVDKATAFKNEVTGSTTNKIVCKASNRDVLGPKKKHVDYLINLTNDPHCSMVILADLIFERLKNTNWIVVFKNLIVAHNLMTLGNERYLQCVATRANSFTLDTFTDRTDVLATDMSVFVRRYSKYLTGVCSGYKTLALDICRMPKGEETPLRTMDPIKLLKTTIVVQQQLDLMLDIEISAADLTNGVINTAFLMLYKDMIKLYAVYNDALINILEKFFEMKKAQCKEAIATYRKFITRQEGVQKFLQLAEEVGVDKQSHLNLRQVPEDLLPALESHLSEMDAIKKTANAQPSPQIKAASEKLSKLHSSPSSSSSSTAQNGKPSPSASEARISNMPTASSDILEAQRKRFEELKRQAKTGDSTGEKEGEKEGEKKEAGRSKEDKLFDEMASSSASKLSNTEETRSALDDLAGLQGFSSQPSHPPTNNPFQTDSFSSKPSGYEEVDLFSEIRGKPQPDFDSVFGTSGHKFPGAVQSSPSNLAMGGDLLTPEAVGAHAAKVQQGPSSQSLTGLTNDVESSLALAAENLSLNLGSKTGMVKKAEHQWKPPAPSVKTGGDNFIKMQIQPKTLQPQVAPPTSQAGGGQPANWTGSMHAGHFPLQPSMMQQPAPQPYQQPFMGGGVAPQWQQTPQYGGGMAAQYSTGQPPQQQHDLFGRAQPSLF